MNDPDLQSDGRTRRNKLGIEGDPRALALAEAPLRIAELKAHRLPQAHGFELVKATHRYLFQDGTTRCR